MSGTALYTILRAYGTVVSVKNVGKRYRVYFKRSIYIDRLKKERKLRVKDNFTISIRWLFDNNSWTNYTRWHSLNRESTPASSLMLAPDADSPTNIINALNDDCIRLIFETCVNDSVGLTELATVCTRFQAIALQLFKTKYWKNLHFIRMHCTPYFSKDNCPLPLVEDFYRIFGESMIAIDFQLARSCDIVNGIVLKYCPKLEYFGCFLFDQQSCEEDHIRLLAHRVKHLSICSWHCPQGPINLTNMLGLCTHLEKLTIDGAESMPPTRLPKLIDLRLQRVQFTDIDHIKMFFALNTQLELLQLDRTRSTIGVEHILRFLPNLRSLNILHYPLSEFKCGDIDCFGRLRKLRALQIVADSRTTRNILDALNRHGIELDKLHIQHFDDDVDVVETVCQSKSLEYLVAFSKKGEQDLRRYVQELPKLVEFKVKIFNTATAVELLQHAQDGLAKISFYVTYDEHRIENMDEELKNIWLLAECRGVILTVVLWYKYDAKDKIPVSVY